MILPLLALGLGLAALASRSQRDRPEPTLVPNPTPIADPLRVGSIVLLVATPIDPGNPNSPQRPFRVQIVSLPDAQFPTYIGVLLDSASPLSAGEFFDFTKDKIASVVTP